MGATFSGVSMSAQLILNAQRTWFHAVGAAFDEYRAVYDIDTREDMLTAYVAFINS